MESPKADDDEPMENGHSEKQKNPPKKKLSSKKRRKQQKTFRYSGDSEDEKLKSRLLKKSQFKRNFKTSQQNKDAVPLVHQIKSKTKDKSPTTDVGVGRYEIINPESYRRLVCRFEENQINKAPKPSTGDFIESRWVCCMCQQPETGGSLGDLFGPYYCKISDTFWPPYLKQKPKKQQDTYTDFWFHGYCSLWTSGILAKGNILTGLDEHLADYWKQKCTACHNTGASIGCVVKGCKKTFHYICATENGCVLQESNLTMHCDTHKKFSHKNESCFD